MVSDNVKKSFVIIFMIAILLPGIQKELMLFKITPLSENRVKAELPDGGFIPNLLEGKESFTHKYEQYYNDNFGYRDFLIKLKNQIDYSLFNVSDKVFIGKDGFLFYKPADEVELPQLDRKTDEQMSTLFGRFAKFDEELKSKGIQLLLVPIPSKSSIYPNEFMAKIKRPEVNGFDKFMNHLRNSDIQYVDTKKVLLDLKKNYQTYYKTDFHYNAISEYVVSNEIARKLNSLTENNLTINNDFKFLTEKNWAGGENIQMGLFKKLTEDIPVIQNNWTDCGKTLIPNSVYRFSHLSDNSCKNVLPKTLLIGNSFTGHFSDYSFPHYFSEINSIHSDIFKRTPSFLDKDTKFVVLQLLENDLGTIYSDAAFWPNNGTISTGPLVDGTMSDIEIMEYPSELPVGVTGTLKVKVTNRSQITWPAIGQVDGGFLINLGYYYQTYNEERREGRSGLLPQDVQPGSSVIIEGKLGPFLEKGKFEINIDLVQEGFKWFSDGKDMKKIKVRVF